jgi:hypothetical protein
MGADAATCSRPAAAEARSQRSRVRVRIRAGRQGIEKRLGVVSIVEVMLQVAQLLGELIRRAVALVAVLGQRAEHDVLDVVGQRAIVEQRRRRMDVGDVVHDRGDVGPVEGLLAATARTSAARREDVRPRSTPLRDLPGLVIGVPTMVPARDSV